MWFGALDSRRGTDASGVWRWSLRACLCATALFIASPASAVEPINYCYNIWAPYAFQGERGLSGVSVDVMREATARAGYVAVFAELPWNRCLQAVRDGRQHAVLDAARRPGFLQGPSSYSAYSNTFWVRGDSPVDRPELSVMRGLRIGLVEGYDYPSDILQGIRTYELVVDYSVDDGTNLRKLMFDRIDVIVADRVSTMWALRGKESDLHAVDPDHSVDMLYPSFGAAFPERQRQVDRAIRLMLDDGSIEATYRAYLGDDRG